MVNLPMAKFISAYLILFYGLVFLHHTIKVVRTLYWHNTMSWHYYNIEVLCYCIIMLLGYYVVMLLCYCNIMLLGHYVVVLLRYCNVMLLRCQGITLLQYYNRIYFIYILIINILRNLLSSTYNLTIKSTYYYMIQIDR